MRLSNYTDFKYSVVLFRADNVAKGEERLYWCREQFGPGVGAQGITAVWTNRQCSQSFENIPPQKFIEFIFKNEDDAILFKLRFG